MGIKIKFSTALKNSEINFVPPCMCLLLIWFYAFVPIKNWDFCHLSMKDGSLHSEWKSILAVKKLNFQRKFIYQIHLLGHDGCNMKYLSKELFQCLMKAVVQAFRAPVFLFETRSEILHCMLQFERWWILLTVPKTSALTLTRHDISMHRLKYFLFQPKPFIPQAFSLLHGEQMFLWQVSFSAKQSAHM